MIACKYGDPLCPCQDGDECHYENLGKTRVMRICGNCEYFDNGKGENDRSGEGDCLYSLGSKLQVSALEQWPCWVKST